VGGDLKKECKVESGGGVGEVERRGGRTKKKKKKKDRAKVEVLSKKKTIII